MVEVYSNTVIGKTVLWSTPNIVLLADHDAITITVPAKVGKRATVAVEDVRLSVLNESFS